jgi:hypothetical protein
VVDFFRGTERDAFDDRSPANAQVRRTLIFPTMPVSRRSLRGDCSLLLTASCPDKPLDMFNNLSGNDLEKQPDERAKKMSIRPEPNIFCRIEDSVGVRPANASGSPNHQGGFDGSGQRAGRAERFPYGTSGGGPLPFFVNRMPNNR